MPPSFWNRRPRTHIEKDLLRLQHISADGNGVRPNKACFAMDDHAMLHSAQPILKTLARLRYDRILPSLNRSEVNAGEVLSRQTHILRTTNRLRSFGARHQRFGGRATRVHTCAAEQVSLNQRHGLSCIVEPARQRGSCLAGANDDCVKCLVHSNLAAPASKIRTSIRPTFLFMHQHL